MYKDLIPVISPQHFHHVASILRSVFIELGYLEVHPQNRLSILAACEDPFTISTFNYAGEVWPLIQTNQMSLEHDLLKNPELPGVFCFTTSYRLEPRPVLGRHHLAFPMFEFEGRGDFKTLLKVLDTILSKFGIDTFEKLMKFTYREACILLKSKTIGHKEEQLLCDNGVTAYLTDFPEHSNPFWNMKRSRTKEGLVAQKCDVLLGGMETIGSAERSCRPAQMLDNFNTIEGGKYKAKLFELFGEERVMAELKTFLDLPFFPRFGGGIGITRLIHGLEKNNLIKTPIYR